MMPARIISLDAIDLYQKIVIDRRKAELIEQYIPVLTQEGLSA